jgi:hypothetical protein
VPRFISLTVALIATLALLSAGGYVLGRWYEIDALASITAVILQYSLYITVFCCGYAMLVGIYHTILSVTGLDREREEAPEEENG